MGDKSALSPNPGLNASLPMHRFVSFCLSSQQHQLRSNENGQALAFPAAFWSRSMSLIEPPSLMGHAQIDADACVHVAACALTLPGEILLLIFKEVTAGSRVPTWPDIHIDSARATAPFAFATVCGYWRQLAIAFADLWTYLGFRTGQEQHALLSLRIERSKNAPVDVFFHPASMSKEAKRCCSRLLELSSRWRHVDFKLPAGTYPGLSSCLTRPTPHLKSIVFDSHPSQDAMSLHDALPLTPSLRQMSINSIARDWTWASKSLLMLTEMSLWIHQWPASSLKTLLKHVSGTLETLSLCGEQTGPANDIGDSFVTLPQLVSLSVHHPKWLRHLRTPLLRRLSLWGTTLKFDPEVDRHLDAFRSVQELNLWGILFCSHLDILQILENVRTVHFSVPVVSYRTPGRRYEYCRLELGLLRKIAKTKPPIWPLLHSVSFGNDNYKTEALMELNLEELAPLSRRPVGEGNVRHYVQLHATPSMPALLRSRIAGLNASIV